jgi:hypothetical protein
MEEKDYQKIKELLEDVVDRKLEEHKTEFWVSAEKHYKDHLQMAECVENKEEWLENHRFTSKLRSDGNFEKNQEFTNSLRENSETVKKITLRVVVTAIVGSVITWIAFHFTNP